MFNFAILSLFFEEPSREFNVREVARLAGRAPATISNVLKGLSAERILKARKERRFDLYSADTDSSCYRDLKTYYNVRKLRESGIMKALDEYYMRPAVVLFGSAARGLDAEASDFDMLVVSEKTSRMETARYEKRIKRRVHLFPVKKIADLGNEHLINNALNGITLQGSVRWT